MTVIKSTRLVTNAVSGNGRDPFAPEWMAWFIDCDDQRRTEHHRMYKLWRMEMDGGNSNRKRNVTWKTLVMPLQSAYGYRSRT